MTQEIKTGDPKLRAFITDAITEAKASIANTSFGWIGLHIAAASILDEWQRGIGAVQLHHAIALAEGVLGVSYATWCAADPFLRDVAGWSPLPSRGKQVAEESTVGRHSGSAGA